MNITKTPAAPVDPVSVKGSSAPKAKGQDNQFKDMLSYAMQTEESSPNLDKTSSESSKPEKATGPDTQRARPEKQEKKTEVADNADAAATVQQSKPEAAATPEDAEPEVGAEVLAAVAVRQAISAPMAQATVQPAQTAQAIPETAQAADILPEQQINVPDAGTQAQAPQTAPQTTQNTQQAMPQGSQPVPQQNAANDTQTSPDIPATVVVTQTQPVENEEMTVQLPQTQTQPETIADEDPAQSRFDDMIARAARELETGKQNEAADGLAPTDEISDEDADGAVKATQKDTEAAKPAAADKTGEDQRKPEIPQTQTVRQMPQTNVVKPPQAYKTEQKPLKDIPSTDEAAIGMAQANKPQPVTAQVAQTREPEPPRQTNMPNQAEQIRTQVIENLEEKKMEFRMQLNPQELGKIDVKMILEGGKLAVEIAAANSKSAELLTKQTESLMASLRLNNIQVSSVNVVTSAENASGYMQGEFNLSNPQGGAQRESNSTNGGNGNPAADNLEEHQGEDEPGSPQSILNYSI